MINDVPRNDGPSVLDMVDLLPATLTAHIVSVIICLTIIIMWLTFIFKPGEFALDMQNLINEYNFPKPLIRFQSSSLR